MAFNIYPSYYRIAKKIVRNQSHIDFLRICKREKVIPKGLRATNILVNTTNSPLAETLALKHSRQWLQLALDTQYYRLSHIQQCVFPMSFCEDQQLITLRNSLREKKQRKLQILLDQQRKENPPTKQQPRGFENLSSEVLDPNLEAILNKGPSFVNAEPKSLPKSCQTSRASLQLVVDKLKEQKIHESAINEFKGGIARIIDESERCGTTVLKSKRQQYHLPSKQVVIIPTDKSKRLVALDTNHYDDILRKSTIETENYQPKTKLNLPRTEQIRFNGQLNKIAEKYWKDDCKLWKDLKNNICSEPLPCSAYCLPKDHKEGDLKGRPIHAATDTPATRLSKFIAKSLTTLLEHVPAHLKNTDEFMKFLSDIGGEIHGFCSLDVCNLYGSIPLEDVDSTTPGVFTVAKRFFSEHKRNCILKSLNEDDFESLLRLCLMSDVILIGGNSYTQKTGLAMGNNLAPILAIIYMNELDDQILHKAGETIVLKRYIDDIFIAWKSDTITAEKLLSIANGLNSALKFTIEMPENNHLPFLDTLVSFDLEKRTFTTTLYVKPIHSQCITPWDSHGPVSSKRAILVGEIKRAIARSTNSSSKTASLRKITSTFTLNGYPKKFVKTVIKSTLRNTQPREERQEDICLKIPFINEELKRKALAVIRRSGINNIRTHFMNGRPSSRIFAAPKDKQNCPSECETCKLTNIENRCLTKNSVYHMECSHCHAIYIGETGRTIGSRIKEHLRMKSQTVYTHLKSHDVNPQVGSHITWKLIHHNIRYLSERKIFEALEIKRHSTNIMNGCVGRFLSI